MAALTVIPGLSRWRRGPFVRLGRSGAVAGGCAAVVMGVVVWQRHRWSHELSIPSVVGRYLGLHPGSKTSITIIAPPQQGQGCASVFGSSGSAEISPPGSLAASMAGTLAPSSSRARAMLAARLPLTKHRPGRLRPLLGLLPLPGASSRLGQLIERALDAGDCAGRDPCVAGRGIELMVTYRRRAT